MAFGKFFMRDTAGSPERARWLHLARSWSQPYKNACYQIWQHYDFTNKDPLMDSYTALYIHII